MKQLITLLALVLAFAANTQAQNNELKLSQAMTISPSTLVTVPAGKLWKVTNYLQEGIITTRYSSTSCTAGRARPLKINGQNMYFVDNATNGSSYLYYTVQNNLPLWLAEGTTLQTVCPNDIVTILEFNVVPE